MRSRNFAYVALFAISCFLHADDAKRPLRDDEAGREMARPSVPLANSLPSIGGAWVSQGPGPIYNAQVEGIPNQPVVGAVHQIVAHPTNANVVWIGSVNGGIWKTTNATNASPTWTATGDGFSSLSIGAMNLDPTDAGSNTLVAGFGRFSSFGVGGSLSGLLRTTNGGTNWSALTPTAMLGKNLTAVAARGSTIVGAVNYAEPYTCGNIGIFRSTNTGSSFSIISGVGGTGLPQGLAYDLAGDPTNSAVLYTAIRYATTCSGNVNGVYKSVNTGATWSKVSSAAMDALMADSMQPRNAKIAVGLSGQIFVGIIDFDGHLAGLFRSANGGSTWTQLDTPSTNENGSIIGIQPEEDPGGQGALHFSIVADPTNTSIVYVGGDRQPLSGDGATGYPNSIGAYNYTGRLFRVNAAASPGSQSTPLTHCPTATSSCNGTISTSSNSAPHADSRRMVFDAAGNLLEADDGGIYKRTNPRTTGDWFSMNGNLRINEMHDVAWDRVSNMIMSGNQDTGSAEQTGAGGAIWYEINQGDGGDVAIDDYSSGTQSRRYSSAQFLYGFYRRIHNAAGTPTSTTYPALTVTGGGPTFLGQFVTPVELNAVDGSRVLIAGYFDLYESLDRGDTITALSLNQTVQAMVFGGKSGGVDNLNLIYAISNSGPVLYGPNVFVRTSGSGAPVVTTAPGSAALRDIAVDPADWHNAYVINSAGGVYSTTTAGSSWTNITGNLGSGSTDLRAIAYVSGSPNAIVVGGLNGVFRMATTNPGVWNQLGTGLDHALVFDLDADPVDDVLIAGTMGRGAWKLSGVAAALAPPTNVVATATSTTTVQVTWTASAGAASYRVYRNSGSGYTLVGSPAGTSFNDTTALATKSYLYKVRAFSGSESADSSIDLATTVIFTDPTLVAGSTLVKAVHFTQLLTAVNAVRSLAGLSPISFSTPTPATSVTVRRQHVLDLRSGLDAPRAALALSALSYTNASIVVGGTSIKAVHLTEIRNGVK